MSYSGTRVKHQNIPEGTADNGKIRKFLLEDAGRTSSSGKNRHSHSSCRRRCRGAYSDGGSDSRGDDCDDSHGYASRKPSGPEVLLKKRLDPTQVGDERGSQEEVGYNNGGSDRGVGQQ
ncbi:hypothetical protein ACFX1Q_011379 [Malus domestica]